MTTRGSLRQLVADILDGATDAGAEVYTPSDWPTWASEYPVILVSAPREDLDSIGKGTVQFTATATIRIVAKAQAAAVAGDLGAQLVEDELERLERQVIQLLVNNPTLRGQLQQYPSIRIETLVSSEAEQHLGELMIDLACEYYVGPEDLFPVEGLPLTTVAIHADLVDRFDARATYPAPAFPASVVPAPRTSGPDGRDEGALLITLPQP